MDHELLHSERGDFDLRLSNKVKKEKDKPDPGERKKWNFRKTSASEASGNEGPSPTFGLINQSSEPRSKKSVSPTMIFENALSDHDEPNDVQVKSPPPTLNLSQAPAPQTRSSPKTPSADQQQGTAITRARQRSLPLSASPPPMINRPQSVRKAGDRIQRQVSVPTRHQPSTLLQQQQTHGIQQSFSSPTQPERPDLARTINELQTNSQWQPIQQPLFTSDSLPNVVEMSKDSQPHRTRALSDKDTPGVESVDDNRNTMWQGNHEMNHGNWTEFLSPSNEVFVPDDRAWAGAENVVVEVEDGGDVAAGNVSNSSQSSNSSESDNEDTEESVWKINEEQRAYYLNQFRILQPAEKGVVAGGFHTFSKSYTQCNAWWSTSNVLDTYALWERANDGQKARDFFLKSGLGTDVLSKIWNLADLDSDGALNFVEFCIAMHIVVAVRHGLDVPATLPQYLVPEKYETQVPDTSTQIVEASSNELSLQDSSQSWARFSPDPRASSQMVIPESDGRTVQQASPQVQAGVQHGQHAGQHVQQTGQHAQQVGQHAQQVGQHAHQVNQHAQQVSQHVQHGSQHVQQVRHHPQAAGQIAQPIQHNHQVDQQSQPVTQHEQQVGQPVQQVGQPVQQVGQPVQQGVTQHQPTASLGRRLERTMSDPNSAEENTTKDNTTKENTAKENTTQTPRKISLGIPRVRGQPKQTNLLDTPHWAILPPPGKFSKENSEETSKGNFFVPTGTIIPADPEENSKPVAGKPEKQDQVLTRDSESDSSSSETERTVNKERPKSLSHEKEDSASSLSKNSSDSSLRVSQDSVDGGKKLSAPVPPPRRRSGHSRSSSLDLQKLFNKGAATSSLQNMTDDPKASTETRETQENFADFSKFENTTTTSNSNENIARFSHRRSASLDSTHAVFVDPSPQPAITESVEAKDSSSVRLEVSASVPRPVPKKKPASPPPPLRQKKDVQQDSGSDSVIEKEKKGSKEPIHFVVKPLTRLEQLHAKIRDLKSKNTRLSRINNELQQELREMMENRVGLESSLEQLKPFAK